MIKEYAHYRREQVIGGALVNFAINAVLAWLLFRQMPQVPFVGAQSIVGDTLATALLLPLLLCLAATPTFRSMFARRAVLRPARLPAAGGLPHQPLLLGLLLGLLALLTLAPLTLWLLQLLQVEGMSFAGFVLFKAAFAAVLAALITPLVLQRALAWHLQNLRN